MPSMGERNEYGEPSKRDLQVWGQGKVSCNKLQKYLQSELPRLGHNIDMTRLKICWLVTPDDYNNSEAERTIEYHPPDAAPIVLYASPLRETPDHFLYIRNVIVQALNGGPPPPEEPDAPSITCALDALRDWEFSMTKKHKRIWSGSQMCLDYLIPIFVTSEKAAHAHLTAMGCDPKKTKYILLDQCNPARTDAWLDKAYDLVTFIEKEYGKDEDGNDNDIIVFTLPNHPWTLYINTRKCELYEESETSHGQPSFKTTAEWQPEKEPTTEDQMCIDTQEILANLIDKKWDVDRENIFIHRVEKPKSQPTMEVAAEISIDYPIPENSDELQYLYGKLQSLQESGSKEIVICMKPRETKDAITLFIFHQKISAT